MDDRIAADELELVVLLARQDATTIEIDNDGMILRQENQLGDLGTRARRIGRLCAGIGVKLANPWTGTLP